MIQVLVAKNVNIAFLSVHFIVEMEFLIFFCLTRSVSSSSVMENNNLYLFAHSLFSHSLLFVILELSSNEVQVL